VSSPPFSCISCFNCCGRCARRRVETESCEFHPVKNRWRSAWLYADVPLEFAVMYCTLSDRPFLSPSRPGFYFRMLFNRPIFPERLLEVRLSKRTACGFCWCDIFTRRMPFLSPNQKYQSSWRRWNCCQITQQHNIYMNKPKSCFPPTLEIPGKLSVSLTTHPYPHVFTRKSRDYTFCLSAWR